MRFYPKADQRRMSLSHPAIRHSRFAENGHFHNLNVVFVDYDGGVVSTAVRQAYQELQRNSFPTLIEHSASQYGQPAALQSAVCDIDYWGALYVSQNASSRLSEALGGGEAASLYNRSDALTFVWNEARYSTVIDSLANAMNTLSSTAEAVYTRINGTGSVALLNASDPTAISIFANPWELASIDIQSTVQGSRLIYNTLVIILILIQEFFFLGTINGLYAQFQLFGRISARRIIVFRLLISALYTLAGSLCTAGAIWAFRAGWHVSGKQWALTWLILWLFAHLNFLTLDVFTVWLPPPYVPMALISWVILNVTSILLPFELSPAFYRWGYALPAHAVFQVLIDIWSGGCNPQLGYALPVLFAYELSSGVLSGIGVYRRSHYAVIAVEREEKAFQEKIAAALEEHMQEAASEPEEKTTVGNSHEGRDETGEEIGRTNTAQRVRRLDTISGREDLADRIWRATSGLSSEQTDLIRKDTLGPSFDLSYKA
ncbi:hypothetical protein ARAM_007155 [Aspergillus rambellii]|uniref:DUF3533 domain-containing protein n=1 Tax=Aspergillus rambellii TaxID=308745 RepID=A0A0F8X8M6_9EURO|nr:hypothetical protein ARAM_007155 [Aspergillus rambellii]